MYRMIFVMVDIKKGANEICSYIYTIANTLAILAEKEKQFVDARNYIAIIVS